MKAKELIETGYKFADMQYTYGYVSRKEFSDLERDAFPAGGSRKGDYYILVPCYHSSRYCFRRYLVKKDGVK